MTARHVSSMKVWARYGLVALVAALLTMPGERSRCADGVKGPDDGGTWEWRVGAASRTENRIRADWNAAPVLGRISRFFGRRESGSTAVGRLDGYDNRVYVDGFVNVDLGTDDPETEIPGLTWFWGYDDASQYRGDSVLFHGEPGSMRQVSGIPQEPWSDEECFDFQGVDLSGAWRGWRNGPVSVGLSGGLSWFEEQDAQFGVQRTVARERTASWRAVDVYGTPYSPFPDAPHEGTLQGPGYLLRNIPDERYVEVYNQRSRDWVATSDLRVDMESLELRMGPSLWLDVGSRVRFRVTPQVLAAHVDATAEAQTVIAPTTVGTISFGDETRERDWLFGAGVEGEVSIAVFERWRLAATATATAWDGDLALAAEPFDVRTELGDWSFTASIGRGF